MASRVSNDDVRCGAFTFSEDTSLCTLTVGCDENSECEDCVAGHAACDLVQED